MNVLLTSVGRRSYLVRYFRHALRGTGRVICINTHVDAPGMYAADEAIVVPPAADRAYVPTVLDLCRSLRIGLVCSLHDLDALVLSRVREEIRLTGAIPVLPTAFWAEKALDKLECGQLLERNGIATPWATAHLEEAVAAIRNGRLNWPLVVKPRTGFGSLGVRRCSSIEDLRSCYRATQEELSLTQVPWPDRLSGAGGVIVQELIDGFEYCIDVVNDLDGSYACHLMCRVDAMRAGESDAATTVDPTLAGDLPLKLSALLGHLGPCGVDVIERDGRLIVLDVNPRFTGDYPFHHLAGADIPAALVAWASGRRPDSTWLKSKVGVRGFKDLIPTLADRRQGANAGST